MDPNALSLWLHCNHCVRQTRDDPKLEIHFTNCGHFFCQNCVQKNTSPKCLVCGVQKVRTMVLGPNLAPDIRHMFQNTIKLPQILHRAMEFQQNQIKQTLHLFRNKADKMTKDVRTLVDNCKILKHQNQELSEETKELEKKVRELHDTMRQRAAVNMGHIPPLAQNSRTSYDMHSNMHSSNWPSKRSETPSFSGMEINAFDPKTPDAFKMGKALLSNAVSIQAAQQNLSPGNHIRNLFSPSGHDGIAQQDNRRLSAGSSGGRVNSVLGLCPKNQSPFNRERLAHRSPNIGINRGFQ